MFTEEKLRSMSNEELLSALTRLKEDLKNENFEKQTTEVYSRIVGYYRSVKNWNLGKKQEYKERKSFFVNNTKENGDSVILSCNNEHIEDKKIEKSVIEDNNNENFNEKIQIFVKNNCPNCIPVKNYISDNNINVDFVNASENIEYAIEKHIMQAPTLLILDKNGNETKRLTNISDILMCLKGIENVA